MVDIIARSANRHLQALKRLGYEVVSALEGESGQGGFGVVYKVKRTSDGSLYAAKALREDHVENEKIRESFKHEAQLWLSLTPLPDEVRHPRTEALRWYDHIALAEASLADEGTGIHFLMLEFVEGCTLASLLRQEGQFAVWQALDFAVQFCKGMAYCQAKRGTEFVHRDIKPNNAMVTRQRQLKLIDFGLSKSMGYASGLTTLIPGTQAYMAPEYALRSVASTQSDVFSFGVMLNEFLFGKPLREVQVNEDARLPNGLVDILKKCLWRAATLRYKSFLELKQALEKVQLSDRPAIQCARCSYVPFRSTEECPLCGGPVGAPREPPAPRPSPVATPQEELAPVQELKDFVLIPAGEFEKGCPDKTAETLLTEAGYDPRQKDILARNRHERKTIERPFRISKHAVTNSQYWEFVRAAGYPMPSHWQAAAAGQPPFGEGMEDYPVTNVSFYDAQAYCRWKKMRLPTDDEWERAARGTEGRLYPWGSQFDPERCNDEAAQRDGPVPVHIAVREDSLSPEGLLHMTGNVWEWTVPSVPFNAGLRGGSYMAPCEFAGLPFLSLLPSPVNHAQKDIGFRVVVPCRDERGPAEMRLRDHVLVLIPGGPFATGLPEQFAQPIGRLAERFGYQGESLVQGHRAGAGHVPAFYISRYAVTEQEFSVFVEETGHRRPKHWLPGAEPFPKVQARLPVVGVSFEDGQAFCAWLGQEVRLPTSWEWEKAARGTDGRLYPWGNQFDTARCNCQESRSGKRAPVDAFENGKSPYGVSNLVGNTWEWVNDMGHLRGGSFRESCRLYGLTFFIQQANMDTRKDDVGFRCVRGA